MSKSHNVTRPEKPSDVELLGGLMLESGELTMAKRSRRSLRLRNALIARGFELAGKRVLDIGCAEGLHALYMADSAAEVVGIDHRQSKIIQARATADALGIRNVTFHVGDIRDPEIFATLGKFDLVVAWGFLHRISDIFSFVYSIEPLADSLSFEWRTPVLPMMSSLSLAYHFPGEGALDPMNLNSQSERSSRPANSDTDKIEGESGFWEPTPGAVHAIVRRLGYEHATLLGYGDGLRSQSQVMERLWSRHLANVHAGKSRLDTLPRARVHMMFEKKKGAIKIKDIHGGAANLPHWDVACLEVARKRGLVQDREVPAR